MAKKDTDHDLTALRDQIDALDTRLIGLLNDRARLAVQVGRVKAELDRPMYAPEREHTLLTRLGERNPGPLPTDSLRTIYREIMSASLALEAPMSVAFFGPEATFTHQATLAHFGSAAALAPMATISDVFDAVERGTCAYGVVPIENSTEGVVTHTLDTLMQSDLVICGEVSLDVHHCLLSASDSRAAVRKVYSHPHALAQCRAWLAKHLPGAETEGAPSTARAAQLAALQPDTAAIASSLAADLYGLTVLDRNIEDLRGNMTRFLVIGRQGPGPSGDDRTSVMFALKDAAGILYRALSPFAQAGISLSRIESRPSRRRAWDYIFFVDLEGHRQDPPVAQALRELQDACELVKVLGSYPRARKEQA